MLLIDNSPSMFTEDTVAAAKAAAARLHRRPRSRASTRSAAIGLHGGFATLDAPLTSELRDGELGDSTTAIQQGVDACTGFCSRRHRTSSTRSKRRIDRASGTAPPAGRPRRVIVFLSDGGNTGGDYAAELAAVKAAGVRVIALGFGTDVNVAAMRSIASSPNDYFYAPSAGELGWALRQHRAGHLPDTSAARERGRRTRGSTRCACRPAHAARRGPRRRTARRSRPDVDLDRGERPRAGDVRRRQLARDRRRSSPTRAPTSCSSR